ncbi:MAG TPA: Gfo/Idh/MocA family oxidoreductase [Bacteroidota bacterium]|nr:Gfo/Idh/MocA family oxidoreductase [Bacteroidota bacterium]
MLEGAIIGYGNIAARGHLPAYMNEALRSKLRIVAVVDVAEQNREKAREQLPEARLYSDIDALMEREKISFVDICTPPSTHADYLRACASRGLHIVCEKPLADTHAAAAGATDALRKAVNVVFVPCHQYKYSPLWREVHDILAAGSLGRITFAQFNVFRLQADPASGGWIPDWRTNKAYSGGGILVDTGAHYLYLAQYFFGIPSKVSAALRTLKHHRYGVEDTAVVSLEYPAMIMQLCLTWAADRRANSVFIAGTEGSLSYDGSKLLLSNRSGSTEIPMPDVSDKNQYVAWYASLLKEFVNRVETKNYSDDLLCEASTVMRLLDLCYRSSEQGKVLDYS